MYCFGGFHTTTLPPPGAGFLYDIFGISIGTSPVQRAAGQPNHQPFPNSHGFGWSKTKTIKTPKTMPTGLPEESPKHGSKLCPKRGCKKWLNGGHFYCRQYTLFGKIPLLFHGDGLTNTKTSKREKKIKRKPGENLEKSRKCDHQSNPRFLTKT